ncbi:MAG: 4Fe-4S dicluster domain-containing protein [Phycisphaerae bacterium]|jgi:heterodisulfide reductase subunit C|nr:4Fe-4S dicluster domain-containing protein [Phycisphaerae bacterium]
MRRDVSDKALHSEFRRTVEELSGQKLGDCYQCGKCSGGCPVLPDVELSTNRIIRMVQLGLKEDVLSSSSIWCCTACGTCNGRCPMGIDIVRVMDTLRGMVDDFTGIPGALEVWTFYQAFLDCVEEFGRLTEIGLMGGYNINSGRLMTNVHKAPWFLMKGKLSFSPHTIKRVDRMQRVFKRIEEIESK